MSGAIDMSTPVTRGELREELEKLATKQDLEKLKLATKQELEKLATKHELEKLATKHELEMWGGALLARIESGERRLVNELNRLNERIGSTEQRLNERITSTEQQLSKLVRVELARHTRANYESMATMISAIDDKYKDLPGRMKRLEATMRPSRRR
jgi:hypothetical protein